MLGLDGRYFKGSSGCSPAGFLAALATAAESVKSRHGLRGLPDHVGGSGGRDALASASDPTLQNYRQSSGFRPAAQTDPEYHLLISAPHPPLLKSVLQARW